MVLQGRIHRLPGNILLLAFLMLPLMLFAQTPDYLEQGKRAFREGKYTEAERLLTLAAQEDATNPEPHYMLARLYFETPLRDTRKAGREIEKALKLDPDNVQYLVARLQQLRVKSWNFITERLRDLKRQELARKILTLDSTNAFAHEELGISYIHDFWRYRNAIALPTTQQGEKDYRKPADEGRLKGENPYEQQPLNETSDELAQQTIAVDPQEQVPIPLADINEFFVSDPFELQDLESQGAVIQRLSARADRAYARAVGHLKKALIYDPRRRPVYERLMQIYALKEDYAAAFEMLQKMYVFFPEDPYTWLYLGYTQYRSGAMQEAARSFETALKYMSPDMRRTFENLEYILPPEEIKAYRKDPEGYAARFWRSKDPRLLTPYNERKLEHYARLVYADLLYGAPDLNLHGWDTERGRILVRYGIPLHDVVIVPSNTARYPGPFNDQKVAIEDVKSTFDMLAEANTFNIWDYGDFKIVFEDPFRNGEYRLYSPRADEISSDTNPWIRDYEIQIRETLRSLPERYEYKAPGRQVELPYLVHAFKGENGLAELYVHYGIPIQQVPPGKKQIDLTVRTAAFLVNADREILAERRRTFYGLRTDHILRFKEANLWTDTQVLRAPAGKHEVSLEFETGSGMTVAVQRRSIEIPDFYQKELAVSDLLLAYHIEEVDDDKPAAPMDVVRQGFSITPAPWSVFSTGQPIYLYFEMYNLQKGEDGQTWYEVEAVLKRKDTSRGVTKVFMKLFGSGKGVSVEFTGHGTSPDEANYLILDASKEEPGLFTLTLRIRDRVSGKTVERHTDLFLE